MIMFGAADNYDFGDEVGTGDNQDFCEVFSAAGDLGNGYTLKRENFVIL